MWCYLAKDRLKTMILLVCALCCWGVDTAIALITCPSNHDTDIHNGYDVTTDERTYLQQGLWHRLPCKSYRTGQDFYDLTWYKGYGIGDPDKVLLAQRRNDQNNIPNGRYGFASEYSLLIKDVIMEDEGPYVCLLRAFGYSDKTSTVKTKIIGYSFPLSRSVNSTSSSLERNNNRYVIECLCADSMEITATYWSRGEGINKETDILATRLSDGTVVQFQDGADYTIRNDSGLVLNYLANLESSRYWCHVFFSDGTLNSCYVDVHMSESQPSEDRATRVTTTSYNLLKGKRQTLPCVNWTPKLQTCGIQWYFTKRNNIVLNDTVVILNYTVANDEVEATPGFDLGSGFDLVIESVNKSHSGVYRCTTHVGNTTDLDVYVIAESPPTSPAAAAVVVPIIALLTLLCLIVVVLWIRCRRSGGSRHGCLCSVGGEQGKAMTPLAPTIDPVINEFVRQLKRYVHDNMTKIPVPPWTADENSYRPIEGVYTQPDLTVKIYTYTDKDTRARYKLNSNCEIFNDGIPEFTNKHVLIQGRRGSGKTTLLSKLAFDWLTGRSDGVLSDVLVVLPMETLVRLEDIGEAVREVMLPPSTNVTASSINEYCSKHPDNVTILIDGCRNAGEVDSIMNILKNQDMLRSTIVITTSQTNHVEDICKNHKLRHVIITGFSPQGVRQYVSKICGKKGSSNSISFLDNPSTLTKIVSLPANLAALCQLPGFQTDNIRSSPTVAEFCRQVARFLFDNTKLGKKIDKQVTHAKHKLTEKERKLLVYLGEAILPTLLESGQGETLVFDKENFTHHRLGDKTILDFGIEVGLLRPTDGITRPAELVTDSQREKLLPSRNNDKVYFVLEILQEFCAGLFLAGEFLKKDESPWIDAIEHLDICKEIDRLSNVFLTASYENEDVRSRIVKHLVKSCLFEKKQTVETTIVTTTDTAGFRTQPDSGDSTGVEDIGKRSELTTSGAADVETPESTTTGLSENPKPLEQLQRQQVVEVCLQINFDSKCESSMNEVLNPLFERIRLVGPSAHTLRLLSYALNHAHPLTSSSLNVKSIEIFHIGRCNWSELTKYIVEFVPDILEDLDLMTVNDAGSESSAMKSLRERVLERDSRLCSFDSEPSDMNVLRICERLQDILDYQSDDGHILTAAEKLVKPISDLKHLESLALVGTILRSEDICTLADKLASFLFLELGTARPLKRLDLRLNKNLNDKGFLKIIKSCQSCPKLSDVRLSLYKVTNEGLEQAVREIQKLPPDRWTTLYLLHGADLSALIRFLTEVMAHCTAISCLHVSGYSQSQDTMKHEVTDFTTKFSQNLKEFGVIPLTVDLRQPVVSTCLQV